MKELGSGTAYNTHNTTSLIRTLKYVPDILQTEEAFTVKEYTHTHIELVRLQTFIPKFINIGPHHGGFHENLSKIFRTTITLFILLFTLHLWTTASEFTFDNRRVNSRYKHEDT